MVAHLRFTVNMNNYNYYGATAPMNMLGEFDQKECPWNEKTSRIKSSTFHRRRQSKPSEQDRQCSLARVDQHKKIKMNKEEKVQC